MLTGLFKGLAGLTRDVVELGDTIVTTTIEHGGDLINEIKDIPDAIIEGYNSGLITDGDDAIKETPVVVKKTPIVKKATTTTKPVVKRKRAGAKPGPKPKAIKVFEDPEMTGFVDPAKSE